MALVTPSLTGKTQSAFVMNSVKPIYFTLVLTEDGKVQSIYNNFSSLSQCVKECAEKDFRSIQSLYLKYELDIFTTTPSTDASIQTPTYKYFYYLIAHIDPYSLASIYLIDRSFVLGFLMALIERSDKEFGESGLSQDSNRIQKIHRRAKRFLCLLG